MTNQTPDNCASTREEIVAYLDGELDAQARSRFEQHIKECATCESVLHDEQRMLQDLDLALNDEPVISLPASFASVVAARAQADLRGVRTPSEKRRAVALCAVMALISFALLGQAELRESVLQPAISIAKQFMSAFGFVWHALFDAGRGLAVIFRFIGGHFILESDRLGLFVFLFLAVALALLTRLIAVYHRTQIIE